jgi:hypothetical protein
MRRSFFVFSLPRSGSAWLSLFLTGKDSFCYHEITADVPIPKIRQLWLDRPETAIGAVDTGAWLWPDEVCEAVKGSTLCVLKRDLDEIELSCRNLVAAGHNVADFDVVKSAERLNAVTKDFLVIEHARFHDIEYLRELWRRLLGTPFEEERARLMIEMNVTRDLGRFGKRCFL